MVDLAIFTKFKIALFENGSLHSVCTFVITCLNFAVRSMFVGLHVGYDTRLCPPTKRRDGLGRYKTHGLKLCYFQLGSKCGLI